MFESIGAFFISLVNAEFDFASLGAFFASVAEAITQNEELMNIWNTVVAATSSFAVVVPFILIVLSLLIVFFGKKMINVLRFLTCLIVGYIVGVLYVSPVINQVIPLPNYISGIVISAVSSVLSKYIYFVTVALAAGYSSYTLFCSPKYIPFFTVLHGNAIACLIIMLVAILLAFLLLKFIEMYGTSVLGAFFISLCVRVNFVDYKLLLSFGWIIELVWLLFIGVLGFIIQYKTRARY